MHDKHLIKKQAAWRDSQGSILIEVLIAMVIFVVGMLSVAAMQINSTKGNTTANRSTRGFIWCSDRMELLMSLPYTDPSLIGAPEPGVTYALAQPADGIDNDYDGQIDEAGESGSITLIYTVTDDAVLPNTKTITVQATWQTPMGQQKSLTLTTVRARNAFAG